MSEDSGVQIAEKALEEGFKAAKEFASKLVSPGLEEGGGIIQDTVKFWRFKNQVNILLKAKKFLEEKGLEPKQIPPKTLVPLLENSSLEDEEGMRTRWTALLINAAHPNQTKQVRPSYIQILKELSPVEAIIMDKIFEMVNRVPIPREEWSYRGALSDGIKNFLHLDDLEFSIAIENLYRLGLCRPPSAQFEFIDQRERRFQLLDKNLICLTDLGFAFVAACRTEE